MQKIALLIPDQILCSAIAEQLKPQYDVVECESMARAVSQNPGAVIADAKCLDEASLGNAGFLLFSIGESKLDATETFAKPLRLGHVVSRIQLHLAMQQQAQDVSMNLGPCKLLPRQKQIIRPDGAAVRLTDKETAVLVYLLQSTEPVPREELLAAVWGYDGRIDTHTLETHIYRLRSSPDMQSVPGWREFIVVKQGCYQLNAGWGEG